MVGDFISGLLSIFTQKIHFSVSGVMTYWWLPTLLALSISILTAPAGISGGVLILPLQVSLFHFTGPAVSSTNLLYNVVAIPLGVWVFARKKLVIWPLAIRIFLFTTPGLFLGSLVRSFWLYNPRHFKMFAGFVLFYVAFRLISSLENRGQSKSPSQSTEAFQVENAHRSGKYLMYTFNNETYSVNLITLGLLCFVVGMVGGMYGIGGGALMSPFLVTLYNLPVHSIPGTTLFGTWATSLFGVVSYVVIHSITWGRGIPISPDWGFGAVLGIGGLIGIYLASQIQRFLPAFFIKLVIIIVLLITSIRYITGI